MGTCGAFFLHFLAYIAKKPYLCSRKGFEGMLALNKTYSFFKKSAITLSIIFTVLLLDKLLSLLTDNFWDFSLHQYDWPLILMQIYRALVAGSLVGGLACWIVVLVLWLVRYMRKQKQLPSLLSDVTPKQEEQILQLLKRVATPSDGSDKMNRAEVATLLATLKNLGHLEDGGDYNHLRLWVESVTELKDTDKIHFNEAYKRALDKRGDTRYSADLKKILS